MNSYDLRAKEIIKILKRYSTDEKWVEEYLSAEFKIIAVRAYNEALKNIIAVRAYNEALKNISKNDNIAPLLPNFETLGML